MKKIKHLTHLTIILAIQGIYLQTAYAEKTYHANVVGGDIVLKINTKTKKAKKGEQFTLKSGSFICYQEGDGKVRIRGKDSKNALLRHQVVYQHLEKNVIEISTANPVAF